MMRITRLLSCWIWEESYLNVSVSCVRVAFASSPGYSSPGEAYKHIFKFWEKREESGSYTFLGSERLHRDWALLASCALLRWISSQIIVVKRHIPS